MTIAYRLGYEDAAAGKKRQSQKNEEYKHGYWDGFWAVRFPQISEFVPYGLNSLKKQLRAAS